MMEEKIAKNTGTNSQALMASLHKAIAYIMGLCAESPEAVLISFYNKKVAQLKQIYSELSIPALVTSALIIIYANSAAIELLGMSRDHLITERGVMFNLIKDGQVVHRFTSAILGHSHIDKMKVHCETGSGGGVEVMLNATIHREPFSGMPLLETWFLLPLTS